ncbi:MAG: efflux RND transporter periplasmic adaptor subunit [Holophagaceae bacterium]|uniref:Efflux RND transporter periplasmic adaptor subunit n=1 Tax=Candidatus Geothrix skivensis TaxID=2954439 RepID=A0A9D7SCV6_9BACT|nr:efflux RND transporter periplasmic adaptor subunit [Candidatus Geothrix skivensis]
MSIRPYLIWTLPVLALAAGAVLLAKAKPKPAASSAIPIASTSILCEGRVTTYPGADVILSAEYGGLLRDLPVHELDQVKAGQVLARLDDREQAAALASAEARVKELEAELRFLTLEQQRQRQLVADGAVGQRAFDDADSRLKLTLARRESALAQVAQLQAALSKLTLRAPFAGQVVERLANPGELLPAGGRLLRLADLRRLRLEAEVDEYDLSRLRKGSKVAIEAEGTTWRGEGEIEEIPAGLSQRRLKALDPSRPTDIRVALVKVSLTPDAPLKLGQRIELRIQAN